MSRSCKYILRGLIFAWFVLSIIYGYRIFIIQIDKYDFLTKLYYGLFSALAMLWWVICWLREKMPLQRIFLIMAIIFGLIYTVIMPPYSAPDEERHINTTVYFSNRLMGQAGTDEDGNTLFRSGDLEFNHEEQHIPNYETYHKMYTMASELADDEGTVSSAHGPLGVQFTSYIPQIAGVTVARICHMGNIGLLLMGRIFSVVFYACIIALAIKIAPVGKEIFFVAGLLPMGMELAASFSYDATVIPLCYLFTAYVLHICSQSEKMTWKNWAVIGVILAYLAPIKVVYVLIGLICFLIPKEKFQAKWHKYTGIAATMGIGFCLMLATRLSGISNLITATDATERYTIGHLMNHPVEIGKLLFGTFYEMTSLHIGTTVGSLLGWVDVEIADATVLGFILVLLFVSIKCKSERQIWQKNDKFWILIVISMIWGAICLAMLLDFTPITFHFVWGVQGRYFLPMLPLFLLLCKSSVVTLNENIHCYAVPMVYFLQFYTMMQIVIRIAMR